MLKIIVLFCLSFDIMAKSQTDQDVSKELLVLLTKTYSMKEIEGTDSLCKSYMDYYNSLDNKTKKEYSKIECRLGRLDNTSHVQQMNQLNEYQGFIKNTSNEISDIEVQLIVKSTLNSL